MITKVAPISRQPEAPQGTVPSTSSLPIHYPHLEGRWIWDSNHRLYWQWISVDT